MDDPEKDEPLSLSELIHAEQFDPMGCLPCRASGCSRYFDQTQWRCAAGRFCRRRAFQERKL